MRLHLSGRNGTNENAPDRHDHQQTAAPARAALVGAVASVGRAVDDVADCLGWLAGRAGFHSGADQEGAEEDGNCV